MCRASRRSSRRWSTSIRWARFSARPRSTWPSRVRPTAAYLTGAGDSPEAGSLSSNVGELWAIVHGVAMVLERWPFVRGIGIRSDNQTACWAVEGCDVRSRFTRHGGKKAQPMDDARERLAELLRPRRVLIRASHVRGHNRAEHAPQRAFNQQADQLARRHATRSNGAR